MPAGICGIAMPAGMPGIPAGMPGIPPGIFGMPPPSMPINPPAPPPLRRSMASSALAIAMPLQPMPFKVESSMSLSIDWAASLTICLTSNNRIGAIAAPGAGTSARVQASVKAAMRAAFFVFMIGLRALAAQLFSCRRVAPRPGPAGSG